MRFSFGLDASVGLDDFVELDDLVDSVGPAARHIALDQRKETDKSRTVFRIANYLLPIRLMQQLRPRRLIQIAVVDHEVRYRTQILL